MKPHVLSVFAGLVGIISSAQGAFIVNDTWLDATRNDPATPVYSENGVDTDLDNNLESLWFNGGTAATAVASAGHLTLTMGSSSSSWSTYFTTPSTPITLANPGDQLKVKWVFTPAGVNALNTSQAFNLAVANSQSATRLTADGSPGSGIYSGYAMYMNMGQTLGNGNPFQLREWTLAGAGNFLSTSGNWGANGVGGVGLGNGATSGNHGYDSGTQYTYSMTLTRNASSGLDIVSSMTGGTLDGDGTAIVSITDASPNSFVYDTFGVRPAAVATSATSFDTTLFQVEFSPVPEPSTFALCGIAALALLAKRRFSKV